MLNVICHRQVMGFVPLILMVELQVGPVVQYWGVLTPEQAVPIFFDIINDFEVAPSNLERPEVVPFLVLCFQCVMTLSKVQQEQQLQDLFQFISENNVIIVLYIADVLGGLKSIVVGVLRLWYYGFLLGHHCRFYIVSIGGPGVYYNVIQGDFEVIGIIS